jgi:hypothetical protein
MVTIQVPDASPYGVLGSLPAGYQNAREAMEDLRRAIDVNYGVAGRKFIRWLVAQHAADNGWLERTIARSMDRFRAKVARANGVPARVTNAFAVIYAAAFLARKAGAIPKSWEAARAVRLVYLALPRSKPTAAPLDRIREYLKHNEAGLVRVSTIKEPYSRRAFDRTAGFIRVKGGHEEVLIPTQRFQKAFPDHRELLQALKSLKHAVTEGGKQPKLSVKAPPDVCREGRVYRIRIGSSDSRLAKQTSDAARALAHRSEKIRPSGTSLAARKRGRSGARVRRSRKS